jgi:hypothetical protein
VADSGPLPLPVNVTFVVVVLLRTASSSERGHADGNDLVTREDVSRVPENSLRERNIRV